MDSLGEIAAKQVRQSNMQNQLQRKIQTPVNTEWKMEWLQDSRKGEAKSSYLINLFQSSCGTQTFVQCAQPVLTVIPLTILACNKNHGLATGQHDFPGYWQHVQNHQAVWNRVPHEKPIWPFQTLYNQAYHHNSCFKKWVLFFLCPIMLKSPAAHLLVSLVRKPIKNMITYDHVFISLLLSGQRCNGNGKKIIITVIIRQFFYVLSWQQISNIQELGWENNCSLY